MEAFEHCELPAPDTHLQHPQIVYFGGFPRAYLKSIAHIYPTAQPIDEGTTRDGQRFTIIELQPTLC